MRVVGLPRGEEHGEARDERSEGAGTGGAKTHGGRFAEGGESTVEGVDAVAVTVSVWSPGRREEHTRIARPAGSWIRCGALASRQCCPWLSRPRDRTQKSSRASWGRDRSSRA